MSNRNNINAVKNWQDDSDSMQRRERLFQDKQDKQDKWQRDRMAQRKLEHDGRLHQYDHLIPPMKKVLGFTARMTWKVMKVLVKTAIRIPGAVARLTSKKHDDPQRPDHYPKNSDRDPQERSISFK